jgi:hypothetical protein
LNEDHVGELMQIHKCLQHRHIEVIPEEMATGFKRMFHRR